MLKTEGCFSPSFLINVVISFLSATYQFFTVYNRHFSCKQPWYVQTQFLLYRNWNFNPASLNLNPGTEILKVLKALLDKQEVDEARFKPTTNPLLSKQWCQPLHQKDWMKF